jgi:hypothetical protein
MTLMILIFTDFSFNFKKSVEISQISQISVLFLLRGFMAINQGAILATVF